MVNFTPNYGAIKEIIDDRKIYTMKDSTGTEFLFEINPLHITSAEIDKTFEANNLTGVWLIDYKVSFKAPTEVDIEKALNDGLIIKIYFTAELLDNYGYLHSILYNEKENKYNIIINKTLIVGLSNTNEVKPYSDELISLIKANYSPKIFVGLATNTRFLFGYLLEELNKSNEVIKNLEERIRILEQK